MQLGGSSTIQVVTAPNSDFKRANSDIDFPALELEILDHWDRIDAFKRSVEDRPADREYVFYDGPPFANGSPHYGHLLASVVKDVVPRYWTMRGYRVERRWGWDTHGLPVEMKVQEDLEISGPREIEEFGVDRFNAACRSLVDDTADEWGFIVRRLGRWVDMENDYRTLDKDFMESVWWVFAQLWDKDLIYRSVKVLPYSWGATTPLSNFEANLDYRDVDDPSITVRLEITDASGPAVEGDHLLIWTTTPWTLPSNLAVAVGPDITYARVADNGDHYWIATERVASVFGEDALVVATAAGSELVGVGYEPPFDYFSEERNNGAFTVLATDEVSTEEGTGLVHMAPAFGEVDFLTLSEAGLDILVDPVDAQGNFTEEVPDVAGLNVKDADATLIGLLKQSGKLVRSETVRHSYPFCYRTGTPLIYKAIPTWFVKVAPMSERLVEKNGDIHWVPDYVGEGRFGNWLEGARDWAISRNRYWGSCIPVWECPNGHQIRVGSIDELEEFSGVRPDDLHKHVLDPITFACSECEGTMTRVPEVLDCWFESGSMPYGQLHYPFENKERFESAFPAQFISEGLDQTRGWFYTLHILATALFDQPAFQNCVVSGMILAEDGRKMSKSLRNYPPPESLFEQFGADALRAYLLDSPVLRAEPIRFSNDGVRQVIRTVLLPLWNTHSFFTTYAVADGLTLDELRSAPAPAERSEIDRWILSVLQSLVSDVNREMEGYFLYNVVSPILGFIGDLTNWYIRRSRRRFWAARGENDADKLSAFATLYEVLTTFSKVLAPVLPFISEQLYQDLVVSAGADGHDTIHLEEYPQADPALIDTELEQSIDVVRRVVSAGHALRKRHEIRVRQPLARLTVITHDPVVTRAVAKHAALIAEELNVRAVEASADDGGLVDLSAKADFRRLGPRLGADVKTCSNGIAALDAGEISRLLKGDTLEVAGFEITAEDIVVTRSPREGTVVETDGELAVALDTRIDDALRSEGWARDFVSKVQQARRQRGLEVSDRIKLRWSTESDDLAAAIDAHQEYIHAEVLAVADERAGNHDGSAEVIDGMEVWVSVEPV